MEIYGPYIDKPLPEYRLNDDECFREEREALRQAAIRAKNNKPVPPNMPVERVVVNRRLERGRKA